MIMERYISTRSNLLIEVFIIGYPERGESIIVFLRDSQDDSVMYSLVIDCFQSGAQNKTADILKANHIDTSKLNMLVWSHPDYDHTHGLQSVLSDYCDENTHVVLPNDLNGEIWVKVTDYNIEDKPIIDQIYKQAKSSFTIDSALASNYLVHPLEEIHLNEQCEPSTSHPRKELKVQINALSPHSTRINQLLGSRASLKKNDLSVAIDIVVGNGDGYHFLFMSDIEKDDIELLDTSVLYEPLLIKIPHHTSQTSANLLDHVVINRENFKPLTCTTTYKTQGLPNVELLKRYCSISKQTDCTGFATKDKTFGVIHYIFDLYKKHEVAISHEGNSEVVTEPYLESISQLYSRYKDELDFKKNATE